MKAADEAAFVEFVTVRRTHLRRIAFALCGDWDRAEDVLQTALVKMYVAWPRLQRQGAAEAWARRTIARTVIDESRRPQRRERSVGDLTPLDVSSRQGPDVAQRLSLVEALQQLPLMQRKVVVLRHWLDLSVAETASDLSISQGTVKSHASRGLAALRELLHEEEIVLAR